VAPQRSHEVDRAGARVTTVERGHDAQRPLALRSAAETIDPGRHDDDGAVGAAQRPFGGAAEDEPLDRGPRVRAHHDDVGRDGLGPCENG
jgi:hypothetical protein